MEISGHIEYISKDIVVSDKFTKRELVVKTDDQYPQSIMIEWHQDKCDLIDDYLEGEEVTVSINIKGRKWISPKEEVKWFNTITGWRIVRPDVSKQSPTQNIAETKTNTQEFGAALPGEDNENLPF